MSKAAICESHSESKFMVHDSAHSLSNALRADFERRQKSEYYKTLQSRGLRLIHCIWHLSLLMSEQWCDLKVLTLLLEERKKQGMPNITQVFCLAVTMACLFESILIVSTRGL